MLHYSWEGPSCQAEVSSAGRSLDTPYYLAGNEHVL